MKICCVWTTDIVTFHWYTGVSRPDIFMATSNPVLGIFSVKSVCFAPTPSSPFPSSRAFQVFMCVPYACTLVRCRILMEEDDSSRFAIRAVRPVVLWTHLPFVFRPYAKNSDGVIQSYWARASRKVRYRGPYRYRPTVPAGKNTFRSHDLGTFLYPTFVLSHPVSGRSDKPEFVQPRVIPALGPWSRYQKRFRLLERMYHRCIHIKRSFPVPPADPYYPVTFVTYTRIAV